MLQKIAIIDYGVGNVHSVYKKLMQLGVEVLITKVPGEIAAADKMILPGIGNFQKAMQNLRAQGLVEALYDEVMVNKKPVLGICLGMQLMSKSSEEAPGESGLGWFDAEVVRFNVHDQQHFKIPHIGWNQLVIKKENELIKNLSPLAEFYFSHSYHLSNIQSGHLISETEYGYPFTSAISHEHIFGVQFHPEKSHDHGIQVLQNFLDV